MPHVAHVDAAADEIVMGRDNVGDDERPEDRPRSADSRAAQADLGPCVRACVLSRPRCNR